MGEPLSKPEAHNICWNCAQRRCMRTRKVLESGEADKPEMRLRMLSSGKVPSACRNTCRSRIGHQPDKDKDLRNATSG